ncbi:MAG: DUF1844 domain-containing protein [Calditrichota bacterium]
MAEQSQDYPEQGELFTYLVSTFYSSAWMQMGKMANPITNKVERDLQQAQFSIDLLDMLKEKTQGNLSDDESNLLEHAIKELKMNYMEEVKKDEKTSKEGGDPSEGEESSGGQEPTRKNIITPDEALGEKKKDSGSGSSNLWTP